MSEKERNSKLADLKMELIKDRANLGKGGKIKINEIKKTIARLLTFNRLNRGFKKSSSKIDLPIEQK